MSQLAYMVAALAVGSGDAAIFHLLTHAFFKALLFLAAGAVIHAVGSNLMRDMGGLRRAMPVTFVTMTVGLLALVGVVPLAGFFSKESVLVAARARGARRRRRLLLGGLAGAGRLRAHHRGHRRLRTAAVAHDLHWCMRARQHQVHEAPAVMRWPLVVLAVPTVVLRFRRIVRRLAADLDAARTHTTG